MTYDLRLTALNLAGKLPHQSADELIAAATKIENHLRGTTALGEQPDGSYVLSTGHVMPSLEPFSEEDKAAYKALFDFKPEVLEWSGTASDVKRLMLKGSTLLNCAREIGTTTFLADFVAEQSREHKQVLWMSGTGRGAEQARELILKRGGLVAVVDFGGLNRFTEAATDVASRPLKYDYIVVDGLASLPYGKEIDFLASIAPMSKHCIFASTPGQERGLFHSLWTTSTDFQKVALMWNTPLKPAAEDITEKAAMMRASLGEKRFHNQFECGFRSIDEEPAAE